MQQHVFKFSGYIVIQKALPHFFPDMFCLINFCGKKGALGAAWLICRKHPKSSQHGFQGIRGVLLFGTFWHAACVSDENFNFGCDENDEKVSLRYQMVEVTVILYLVFFSNSHGRGKSPIWRKWTHFRSFSISTIFPTPWLWEKEYIALCSNVLTLGF